MRITFLFMAVLLLGGCHSTDMLAPSEVNREESVPPDYSVIYIIHGDANYLYHDANGKALEADEEVLEEAKAVGKQAKNGEVFIFHQKPERKILWLFPKKDRRFFQYRNGTLVRDERYSPQSGRAVFTSEIEFYKRYSHPNRQASSNSKKVLLYFGHEIPFEGGQGYFASRPKTPFGTDIFAKSVASFLPTQNARFDLTVLSTCNNGTPAMLQSLSPHSRYVLASPQNLHLSHMDTGRLSRLLEQGEATGKQIADSLASRTYERLSSFLQTVITLSVYDTDAIGSYLGLLNRSYQNYLSARTENKSPRGNIDCDKLPFFDADEDTAGLEVWYKPPRFGQKENAEEYSGWGCKNF
jgi:hypothetical protein